MLKAELVKQCLTQPVIIRMNELDTRECLLHLGNMQQLRTNQQQLHQLPLQLRIKQRHMQANQPYATPFPPFMRAR